jgi:hypothetical protein
MLRSRRSLRLEGGRKHRGLMVRDAAAQLLTTTVSYLTRRALATWSAVTSGAALPQALRM